MVAPTLTSGRRELLRQGVAQLLVVELHLLQVGLALDEAAGDGLALQASARQSEPPAAELITASFDAVRDATDEGGVSPGRRPREGR